MASASFSARLLRWFDRHGRQHLPWQQQPTPYRVWVSEIMLQQTQVNTVIPYYERFMQRFPTVQSLAAADSDDVLAHWSGLGYYARARNLHKAAQQIVHLHRGKLPRSVEELEQFPGIGRSTAGAIVSLAFGEHAVILDGNVKRVLARHHAVNGAIDAAQTLETLWQLAEQHTPQRRVGDYTQAIMDLGATVCTRTRPRCGACPVQKTCVACQHHEPTEFPRRKRKTKTLPERSTVMLLIANAAGEIYLELRPASGIWGGLWSLPEVADEAAARAWCEQRWKLRARHIEPQQPFSHTFTHFRLHIQPLRITLSRSPALSSDEPGQWCSPQALLTPAGRKGLATPVRRLLKTL